MRRVPPAGATGSPCPFRRADVASARGPGREPGAWLTRQLVMADVPRLDEALLPERHGDERTEFDDLRAAKVLVQPRPHRVVRALGIPDEHARVQERDLLPRREAVGHLELQEVGVVNLGEALVPPTERPLRASVLALDRLR